MGTGKGQYPMHIWSIWQTGKSQFKAGRESTTGPSILLGGSGVCMHWGKAHTLLNNSSQLCGSAHCVILSWG
jgi:hypothetical protein